LQWTSAQPLVMLVHLGGLCCEVTQGVPGGTLSLHTHALQVPDTCSVVLETCT